MIFEVSPFSDFSINNLPFGIFSTLGTKPRPGVAYGEFIVDLAAVRKLSLIQEISLEVLENSVLNPLISLGKDKLAQLRQTLQNELQNPDSILYNNPGIFISQAQATMHVPVQIGDYTDFYSSEEHARNVGKLYRDPDNALMPNWKHLPVGYHGRSSSIVVSGADIKRPGGQVKPKHADLPYFAKTNALDFELEMGFIIGKENQLGSSIATSEAEDYIFGMVLLNDWSARDIQKWEYVPLGPFLGKNFATSISPWIIPMDALEAFRTAGPDQDPPVLPYLQFEGSRNFDINLEVWLRTKDGIETLICNSNYKYLYWNMAQQLAHHSINGCNLKVGDLMGSGTISGIDEKSFGSMLELSFGGKKEVLLKNGNKRKFLEDYDTVIIKGFCENSDFRVGFGEVSGKIVP